MGIKGIDVSHWQGNINWKKVAGDGIKFAFIKATEGTTL
ncbi:GH25 family lysozyme, partial [Bacillus licheniformis]